MTQFSIKHFLKGGDVLLKPLGFCNLVCEFEHFHFISGDDLFPKCSLVVLPLTVVVPYLTCWVESVRDDGVLVECHAILLLIIAVAAVLECKMLK